MNNRQYLIAALLLVVSPFCARDLYGADYADYAAKTFSVIAKDAASYDTCKAQNFIQGSPGYSAVGKTKSEIIDKINNDPKDLPSGISAEQLRAIYTRVLQEEQAKVDATKGSLTPAECKDIEKGWNNTFSFGDK